MPPKVLVMSPVKHFVGLDTTRIAPKTPKIIKNRRPKKNTHHCIELDERSPKMCFLTTLLNGNPVSDASEVRRANIWLMIPKVANFLGLPYAP